MKKSLTLFLTLLIAWFSVAMHQCICPPATADASSTKSTVISQLSSSASDLCNDCGHTRSCCKSQEQPVAALSVQANLDLEPVTVIDAAKAGYGNIAKRPVIVGFSDRGPPPGLPPTLLNQRTLFLI